ncbi:MAG: adenylosuccinate lyase [Firmicutes bacterium]|nr:adenylosuccinate lyase [Bacillota bacterium]MDI6704745.1 adenylosuccinate lyase [Bacillota bacterium]
MHSVYKNPLTERYASREMTELFSDQKKFSTWRRLWIALAEAQKELGLDISQHQIEQMREFKDMINFETAREKEKEVRHDVMAHVHAFGQQCPDAKPIIHLGATSAFVGDNTDIILIKEALHIIEAKLVNIIRALSKFALDYKDFPTLAFTHFQPAQLTTVGKRACLWIQDLYMDLKDLQHILDTFPLLGAKGTTGTQASFLKLFNGDHEKVVELDRLIAEKMGFSSIFPVTGQTYPRKQDARVLSLLSSIAQSTHKFSNDMRLLQHLKEIEEPFEDAQIGSSAMAYKRNPMRSERIGALSRLVIVNSLNPSITASQQWFERTLDDSANRRISIPEAFLAVDAILLIYINIAKGLVVNKKVIERHVKQEIPFMATENILMESVKNGGDRQDLHEKIRKYSMAAAAGIKEGGENKLMELIAQDASFKLSSTDIDSLMDPKNFIGRSPEQVDDFVHGYIEPELNKYKSIPDISVSLTV